MNVRRTVRWAALAASTLVACGEVEPVTPSRPVAQEAAQGAEPWFVEESAERGVDFVHVLSCADRGEYHMPDMVSGGGALFDAERDGDLDLLLVQGGDHPVHDPALVNRFYRNGGAGRFADETDASGLADARLGIGAAIGDVDGDGYEDVFVTNYGPDGLFLSRQGRRFDLLEDSGAEGDGFSTSAVFFDADRDGDLDLWVLDYLLWNYDVPEVCQGKRGGVDYCGPKSIDAPTPDHFYVNDGNGRFRDASESAGVSRAAATGLGVLAGDFDGDGWQDVFVANDGWPDHLWHNERDLTFEDVAMRMGCAVDESGQRKAGMGVTAADIDDDGDLDLAVCNLGGETDAIYRNEGTYFFDQTAKLGVASASRHYTRFGMGWVDFDNDGRLDLYQANGRVQRPDVAGNEDDPYAEENLLLRGLAGGTFERVEPVGGTLERLVDTSRGAMFGDVDGDGGVDVVVVNRCGAPYLLRNVIGPDRGWIEFDVRNERGGVALGATVVAKLGERTLTRDVRAGYSYVTSNDPRVHLGLGDAAGVTDVRVRWVDGTEEVFGDFEGGRVVQLARGAGR